MAPINLDIPPLTLENLSRLPIAPPNLQTYIRTSQDFERVSVGANTGRVDMVEVLKEWDRRWARAAGA